MPTANRSIDVPGTTRPGAPFSSAIEIAAGARLLYTAGLVGMKADGSFDSDIAIQTEQLFEHLTAVLAAAGMRLEDIVQMTTFVTDMSEYSRFSAKRKEFLGDIRPALALVQVAQLVSPACRVEVTVVAARVP